MDKNEYRGFLYAASKDVLAVEALSEADVELHSEAIAFHAQQAAEKMIKAVYTSNGEIPPKSHDIGSLLSTAIDKGWLVCDENSIHSAINLSMFAVAARYESTPEISKGEAIQAMADCNSVAEMLDNNGYKSIRIDVAAKYLHDIKPRQQTPDTIAERAIEVTKKQDEHQDNRRRSIGI